MLPRKSDSVTYYCITLATQASDRIRSSWCCVHACVHSLAW
uniref:Uncharacterized protein n=1 Tax=Arundo donax TaxID=35708 RepID=A0A0A9B108_ARUDO